MENITITKFKKLKPIIRTDTILKLAFTKNGEPDESEIARVRSKIYRMSPEFTTTEAEKLTKVLEDHGIEQLKKP